MSIPLVKIECSFESAGDGCTATVVLIDIITTQVLAEHTAARASIVPITLALAAIVMLLVAPKHIVVVVQMAFPFGSKLYQKFN